VTIFNIDPNSPRPLVYGYLI